MIKYLLGFIVNIFNLRVSKLAMVDYKSSIHKKAKIYRHCQVFDSNIGAYTYIAPNSSVVFAEIGKFCSISQHVSIGLAQHSTNVISSSPVFLSKNNALKLKWTNRTSDDEYRKVVIGNDVWIGMNVLVKGGVNIGHGAVIGAGSIVTKDIPAYAVAVGSPAKVIKYRFSDEIIEKLLAIKWWDSQEDFLKEHIDLFNDYQFVSNELLDDFVGNKKNR